MRRLIPTDIKFCLHCENEDMPVRGNCMASGDELVDREAEEWILKELDGGNLWAWCFVTVRATWAGFTGRDSLGCCSYRSEADFCQRGEYYEDMIAEAVDDLIKQIRDAGWGVEATEEDLDAARQYGFEAAKLA